jgi:hypothetical protein
MSDEDKVTNAEIENFYQAEDDEARYVHFNGAHVQDPPEHGEFCVDSCPYDTPEQELARLQWEAGGAERDAEQLADAAVWEAEDIAEAAVEGREAGQ